jgi:hypothetical protein
MSYSADKKVWEMFCTVDGWVETDEITYVPTECPINSGHTVNPDSIHIIKETTPPDFLLDDTKSIVLQKNGTNITRYYSSKPNEIHISQDGQGDYSTIAAALAAHQVPNSIYIVHPGTYIEANPLTLPFGSTIKSHGNAANTTVVAAVPTQPIFIMDKMCEIESFTLYGAIAPGGCGVYYDGTGTSGRFSMIRLLIIMDCYYGIRLDGGPNKFVIINTVAGNKTYTMNKGIYMTNGADCNSSNFIVAGNPINKVPVGIELNNARIHSVVSGIQYPVVGLHCDNGGEFDLSECFITEPDIGLCVGNIDTTSSIYANTLDIRNSVTNDVKIMADDAIISIKGGKLNPNKIDNPNNVKLHAEFHTEEQNKRFSVKTGDVRFGDINEPSTLQVGEGKYIIEDISVLHNEDLEAGAWVDKSADANSYDGSIFELFPTETANSCVYIGSEHRILGMKSHVSVDGQLNDTNDVVWEYSASGNTWVEMKYMANEASEPYHTYTDQFFEHDSKQHIRFGITKLTPVEKRVLNGTEKYWVRGRVVNDMVSIPELEYLKIHASSSKMNSDGWMEYFGDARPVARLPWSINMASPANSSPSNRDLYIGDNLGVGRIENLFVNSTIDRLGLNSYLPQNIDTSFPLKLKWAFTGTSDSANNVKWIIRWGFTADGDDIYDTTSNSPTVAPGEKSLEVITSVPGSYSDKQVSESAKLDIQFSKPRPENGNPDIIWITLERTGNDAADTYTGHVAIVQLNVEYIKWCEGGHILSY